MTWLLCVFLTGVFQVNSTLDIMSEAAPFSLLSLFASFPPTALHNFQWQSKAQSLPVKLFLGSKSKKSDGHIKSASPSASAHSAGTPGTVLPLAWNLQHQLAQNCWSRASLGYIFWLKYKMRSNNYILVFKI